MNNEQAIVERKPDAPAEWRPREEIDALAKRLETMLPGDLSRAEALTLAQYSAATDSNPFRGEIYAYEQHGKVRIVEGYKLLVRWARRECNFSERYESMDPEELEEGAIGWRCYVLRDDAQEMLRTFVDAGAPWNEAFQTAAQEAVGVVTQADRTKRNGQQLDPPTGWTWDEVARKRALKNALSRAYGAPSPREIAAESWHVGNVETEPVDWQQAAEEVGPGAGAEAMARAAAMIAQQRTAGPVSDEVIEAGRKALREAQEELSF